MRWGWAKARPWQTNAVLAMLGLALIEITRRLVIEYDGFVLGFSMIAGASLTLWLAAVVILLVLPGNVNRWTLPILLSVAVACRLVVLFPEPHLSSDVYRYCWDGVVQHAGISPYRYIASNPALTDLREPNQDLYDHMNRRDYAHTIYPPAAQALFYLVTWINPEVTMMKTAMVLFEGLTLFGLLQILKLMKLRRERAVLYAWCPLAIWEFAGSGHLDAAAIAFMVLAVLFRYRREPVWTGVFLGLAVLTKLYPIVLLPALYQRGRDADKAPGWTMPAVVAGMVVAGYAAYASVGKMVFGFFGGYVEEEGIASGTRYFLLEWMQHRSRGVGNGLYFAFVLLVFAGLAVWAWRTGCRQGSAPAEFLKPCVGFAWALMLLFSPHYPWYIAWLIPFLVLLPNLPMLTYIAAFFYLCTTAIAVGTGPKQYLLNEYLYGAVLVALIIGVAARYAGLPRKLGLEPLRMT